MEMRGAYNLNLYVWKIKTFVKERRPKFFPKVRQASCAGKAR